MSGKDRNERSAVQSPDDDEEFFEDERDEKKEDKASEQVLAQWDARSADSKQKTPEVILRALANAAGEAPAGAGDKIKVGKSEVEYDRCPDGKVRAGKITYEDGSSLNVTYGANGKVEKLELKDPQGKTKESYTSSDGGQTYTHRDAAGKSEKVEGNILVDADGNCGVLQQKGQEANNKLFRNDGSVTSEQIKPTGASEATTVFLDGSQLKKSVRQDKSAIETLLHAGTPPTPVESRLVDADGVTRQRISFDQQGRPAKITLFEGADRNVPSAVMTAEPGLNGQAQWKRTVIKDGQPVTDVGSVGIENNGKVKFTAQPLEARQPAVTDTKAAAPPVTPDAQDKGATAKPAEKDRPAAPQDRPAAPQDKPPEKVGNARIEYDSDRQPKSITYNAATSVEFKREGGVLKEVKVKNGGQESVWESVDGRTFKLKGNPDTTATISLENGKLTIEARTNGRNQTTELHADGSQRTRTTDASNNVWTTTRSTDGKVKEEIAMADNRRIVREYDRNGAKGVAIFGADGKPTTVYSRIPGTENWQKIDMTKTPYDIVVGRLAVDSQSPEPRFTRLDQIETRPDQPSENDQQRRNIEAVQDTLIGAFPSTTEGRMAQIQREYDRKFQEELGKLNLPPNQAVWTQDHRKQIEDLRKQTQEDMQKAMDQVRTDTRSRIEAVEAERRRGEFGPATKQMYKEYVDWLQTTGVPAYQRMQAQMATVIPADCPRKLPPLVIPGVPNAPADNMDPASYRAAAGRDGGLPPVNLGIDTNKDTPPTFEELQRLGKAMLWMKESQEAIQDARRYLEVNTLIPEAIRSSGLPDTWNFRHYPGMDQDAYRAAYNRASDAALRTRNLITVAIDSDKLNLAQSQNWFRRSIEDIRRDLNIPPEWKVEIDPVTKKVTKIDLDLPDKIDPNDPVVKQKLERLERWLADTGKKLETAIGDAMAKEKDPSKFLYWGTTELPKDFKFKGADGKEYPCNVLQSSFDITNRDGKIVVRYTIQPQNASIVSYQNLPAFCSDAGPPFVEERTYDPEDFVMVRHGMDGVQMVKAKDLASWKSTEQTKYYTEKGLVAAMDIGMVVTGLYELRAAGAAGRVAAGEALKTAGREMVISRGPALWRLGLGATGIFNNAGMRNFVPMGDHYSLGQLFLDARGAAFVGDVALGLPGQLRSLAGAGRGLEVGSRAWKIEEAGKSLSTFWRGTEAVNRWQMTLANFGFAPMVVGDIRHQIQRPDMQSSLDQLRVANRIVNGPADANPADAAARRFESYAKTLDMAPAVQQETNKMITDTTALLRQPPSPTRDAAVQKAKEELAEKIKTSTDKNVQLVAAAALLSLSQDASGKVPAQDTLVTRDGQPLLTRQQLDAVLQDDAARLGTRALVSSELRVQLGTMSPVDYGRALKTILDDRNVPDADAAKQWAVSRSEFIERTLAASLAGANPAAELDAAARTLEAYEQQLGQTADPATKAKLKEIIDETKRLLELKEKDPQAYEREAAKFKEKLMEFFRNDNGAAIRDEEQRQSNRNGSQVTLQDSSRASDVAARGPSGTNRQLQVAAAAALLMLNRDRNGNLNPDATAASRDIKIGSYEFTKVTTKSNGPGAPPSRTEERVTVPERNLTQTVQIKDLVAILQADATSRESGSRRVASADVLFHAGAMDHNTYSAVLKDVLQPPPGLPAPTEQDRRWALERMGFLANAQRALEQHQERTLDPAARAQAAGRAFGVSSQDLQKVLQATAANPAETPDNRARAAFILRSMQEKPDDCQRMLQDHYQAARQAGDKPGDFAKFTTDKLKRELQDSNLETRYRAANALSEYGQLTKAEYNAVMMQCLDTADPQLKARAIASLKVDNSADLTAEQRQRLYTLLNQPPSEVNEAAQIALLKRIDKIVTPEEMKTVHDRIAGFISPDSRRYASNSTDMRAEAVRALGAMKHSGAADIIQKALEDQAGKVRIAALDALARISPPGLDKVLDAMRAKENDPAVRMALDNHRFSVPRETDVNAFKRQWDRMIADMPKVWFEKGTSGTDKGVRDYLEAKFGKEKDPITGEDKVVLLNLKNLADNTWADNCNAFYAGMAGRAASRFGRGLGYLVTFGQADIEVNPYGTEANNRHLEAWAQKGRDQVAAIIADANGENPDQAIATLGYLARNNGDPLCSSIRDYAQTEASQALINLAKAGGKRADLALREMIQSITDQDINVNVRQRYLDAIKQLSEGAQPVLSKEQAAHIIFQAMQAELVRTKSKEPPAEERAASVKFWTDCLDKLKDLNPRGYLGPHYEGGATPILQFMAYNHPFPEVRTKAAELVAKLKDSALETFDRVPAENGLTPQAAAQRLTDVLKNTTHNPERVVEEIARTCKAPPITSADDPRIAALQQALSVPSEKVKIAAAKVLLERANTAVTPEARVAACRALGQVQAQGQYHSIQAWSNEAKKVAEDYFNYASDRQGGAALEEAFNAERQRLATQSPRQGNENPVRKMDGSALTYNAAGRIEQVQYPQRDMSVASTNLRWDATGSLTSIQRQDGKTWTRVAREGRLTDEWTCDGAVVFKGQIEVKPDGTIIQTRMGDNGKPVSRETVWTNGSRSTTDYNPQGQPSKITFPDGRVLQYQYDAQGKLLKYSAPPAPETTLADGYRERNPDGKLNYSIEVKEDGSYSYHCNDGRRYTRQIDGTTTVAYAGPPKHLTEAAGKLAELPTQGQNGAQIAAKITELMNTYGVIRDSADPRIAILQRAAASPNEQVAQAAREAMARPDNSVKPTPPATNWSFGADRPFDTRMGVARQVLADRSWGEASDTMRRQAGDFVAMSCVNQSLPEAQRMEAIRFLLKDASMSGDAHQQLRQRALEGLGQIAASGKELKAEALELLNSLDLAQKSEAISALVRNIELSARISPPASAADMENALSLVMANYDGNKNSPQAEALVWRMLNAVEGKMPADNALYKRALASVDRNASGSEYTALAADDPRRAAMTESLRSQNPQVRLAAALALTDKNAVNVSEATKKSAFDELHSHIEKLLAKAGELETGTNNKEARVKAWAELESFYARVGAKPEDLAYTYATARRIEAEHGRTHPTLLPLYERMAAEFQKKNDPMQAEEYKRRAEAISKQQEGSVEVRDLRARMATLNQQLAALPPEGKPSDDQLRELASIAQGLRANLGSGSASTAGAYENLGTMYLRAGKKQEGEQALTQAAAGYEATQNPSAGNVYAVLAKHYASENRTADLKATTEKVLAVSRWRGTQDTNITNVTRLMDLAEYLTSANSTQTMQTEAEGLLTRAAELQKDAHGEGSDEHLASLETLANYYRNPNVGRGADAARILGQVQDLRTQNNGGMLAPNDAGQSFDLAQLDQRMGNHNQAAARYEQILKTPGVPPNVLNQARMKYADMLQHYGFHQEAAMVANGGIPARPIIPGPDAPPGAGR